MNQKQAIERLGKEAKTDKALDAFLHDCALRERARGQLTLEGMDLRMKKAGFTFDKSDYVRILNLLGELGFGSIVKDTKGRTTALKDIRIALQSIGKAALGQPTKLSTFRKRVRYKPIAATMPNAISAPVEITKAPKYGAGATAKQGKGFPVSITVLVNGKPVNFRVNDDLDAHDLADVILRFRDHGWDKEL